MNNHDDILNNAPSVSQNGQLSKEEYAARKQSEREELFALSDNTAMKVAGNGDMFKQYLDVQSKFVRYSTVNTLLITAQNPDVTRLGSFDYWKNQGCYVSNGERAISILEPHEYAKPDGTAATGYNIRKVFDISQVDTRKIKVVPPQNYTERQLLGALISKAPVKIVGVETMPSHLAEGIGAIYDNEGEALIVLKGMEFGDTFRGVAQELAYVELIKNKTLPADLHFSAYCAAYQLCKMHNVDTQQFDFTNSPEVFNGMETKDIKAELGKIKSVTQEISGRMTKHLEAVQKNAKNQEAR